MAGAVAAADGLQGPTPRPQQSLALQTLPSTAPPAAAQAWALGQALGRCTWKGRRRGPVRIGPCRALRQRQCSQLLLLAWERQEQRGPVAPLARPRLPHLLLLLLLLRLLLSRVVRVVQQQGG